eukprot:m.86748 g.86748  ORF g.86748 m.86748 type:complete len:142 (-) comp8771_c0_seq1:5-430(-)
MFCLYLKCGHTPSSMRQSRLDLHPNLLGVEMCFQSLLQRMTVRKRRRCDHVDRCEVDYNHSMTPSFNNHWFVRRLTKKHVFIYLVDCLFDSSEKKNSTNDRKYIMIKMCSMPLRYTIENSVSCFVTLKMSMACFTKKKCIY